LPPPSSPPPPHVTRPPAPSTDSAFVSQSEKVIEHGTARPLPCLSPHPWLRFVSSSCRLDEQVTACARLGKNCLSMHGRCACLHVLSMCTSLWRGSLAGLSGIHHIITVPSGQVCLVWHDGEARILGSELASWSVSSLPGAASTGVVGAGAAATASSSATSASAPTASAAAPPAPPSAPPAPHVSQRRFEIESSNFRLASVELDGYNAWASQVGAQMWQNPDQPPGCPALPPT
jgi:hypothetical protein